MMDFPTTYVKGFHNEKEVQKMKYSNVGHSDIQLSQLGLGGAGIANLYGQIDEADGISLVRESIKRGVNYIDTSPYYGHTYSETILGKALAGLPRQSYYISTKVGRYGVSWADFFDHSAERILKEFDSSLKRLGLDYVDILLVHDIEFSPLDQILNEALPAVQSLKDKKKTNLIGISGYPLSVLKEAVERSPVKIDVILTYSRDTLFDATAKKYISFFQDRGIGIINASLTGMGLLTNEGPPSWHCAPSDVKEICNHARAYCTEQNVELGKLAIYYAMQQPGYCSHLVGMKQLKELDYNLEIVTAGLSDHELSVLDQVKQKFFGSGESYHWEGVELDQLKEYRQGIMKLKST